MPADQRIGFNDDESLAPSEESRQLGHGETNGVGGSVRLRLSLHIECEQLAQKQIFRRDGRRRPDGQTEESQQVDEDTSSGSQQFQNGIKSGHAG